MNAHESNALRTLDRMRGDELRAMTSDELRRFLDLLEHWRQLAQLERERRAE